MRTDGIHGFYPIVETSDEVAHLLDLGVRTVQLRNKRLAGDALRRELGEALESAERFDAQMFVNDYWEIAAELGATYVHLGQRDLDEADDGRLRAADLRLGISSHSPGERDRAMGWDPAYLALGPIWETTLKRMPWAPQGLDRIRAWKRAISCPLVAIGGITFERAPAVLSAGADAIAVVSDIRGHDRDARVLAWLELFAARKTPGVL